MQHGVDLLSRGVEDPEAAGELERGAWVRGHDGADVVVAHDAVGDEVGQLGVEVGGREPEVGGVAGDLGEGEVGPGH